MGIDVRKLSATRSRNDREDNDEHSLHRNNNSHGDEYYEGFVVIESIPMSRPFLPLTVLLVYFVDFQPIGDRTARAIHSIRDENSPRIGRERQTIVTNGLFAGFTRRTVFLDYERHPGKIDLSFRASVRVGCMGIVTGFERIEQRR